ncbi:MAG: YeeE/YedE family protein [Gammaproteobacteria bacterium]|nr:YeeE/YedE family protein [Gammaproteobacteria bacterium]
MIFENFFAAHQQILWLVFVAAFILGFVANKTNFCTMGAISDLVNIGDKGRFRAWLLAMAVAIIGVVLFESFGLVSVENTLPPYRGSNFAWLEYILGGIIFGIGMTYGSGCGNKTLIRIGGGNIKSVLVFVVIAIVAYFMLNPFPGTDKTLYSELFYGWTSKASVSLNSGQDLGNLIAGLVGGSVATIRTIVGLVLAALLLVYIFRSPEFRSSVDNILAGLIVGLVVLGGWYITGGLASISTDTETMSWTQYASAESWDMLQDNPDARPKDVGVQSFTFINPIGQTLRYAVNGFQKAFVTFGIMSVLGVVLGSFMWAMASSSFRAEWFVDFRDFFNHLIGAVLMGIGGVLGLGCTIGQGITGISTLAAGSFLTFGGIVFGSALTMKIQYYKLVYEADATFVKALLSALVDFKMLPASMRKLDAV